MQKDYRQLIFDNPITGFAYYRAVFDDMGKPVDLVFLEMNETFEKLTGISRKELINKSLVAAVP
ncbi:MAG TPA: PAS domain-containing protein, partial [Chryseolinea sp.]|nr:PAS domain-containing protein [Chryseolinea sp.]